ncbi:MAG TPA: DNA-binding response regulator [Ktedonobacter sp.]|jgi:two-component system KDP operon response regulator KdpE|nr:DNA-binding response regulator [Ktedonobacter sp.]
MVQTKGKLILVVDDEPPIQRILKRNLLANGYEVIVADNGRQAIDIAFRHQPDLILLDLYLPGELDGLDVCRQIRKEMKTLPIIVLSAIIEERQKVRALDMGADDYLTKPFSNEELQARVRACLRRVSAMEDVRENEAEELQSDDGHIQMNIERRQVFVGGQEVRLTPTEFELLRLLLLYAGKVLTHRSLLQEIWGPEYGEEADYLRVYIRQLRVKVEVVPSHPQYILTEPGIGYVFRSPMEVSRT